MKNLNKIAIIAILFIVTVTLAGCDALPGNFSSDGTGELQMLITDAPVDSVNKVNISVEKVEINSEENGWEDFADYSDDPKEFDLLSLQGITEVLGEKDLETGVYNQIRLYLSDASVVKDGTTYDVFIPSEAQTGLKLVNEFTIEENIVKALLLDFDVRKSLTTPGPEDDTDKSYIMRPTIRVIDRIISGDVEGTLVNNNIEDFSSYIVKAYSGEYDDYSNITEEEITSTIVNEDGSFKIIGLEEGNYTLVVYETSSDTEDPNPIEEEIVTITAEEITETEINIPN